MLMIGCIKCYLWRQLTLKWLEIAGNLLESLVVEEHYYLTPYHAVGFPGLPGSKSDQFLS